MVIYLWSCWHCSLGAKRRCGHRITRQPSFLFCCGKISHFFFPKSVVRTKCLAFRGPKWVHLCLCLDSVRGKVITWHFLPTQRPSSLCYSDAIWWTECTPVLAMHFGNLKARPLFQLSPRIMGLSRRMATLEKLVTWYSTVSRTQEAFIWGTYLHSMQLSLPGQVPETGRIPKEASVKTALLGVQTLVSLTWSLY